MLERYPTKVESEKYSHLYANNYGVGPIDRTMIWALPRMLIGKPNIIDLGCGRGEVKKLVHGYRSYLGLDIAERHIERMQARSKDRRDTFVTGNICDLPYEDNEFELGISIDVLEHVPPEFASLAVEECSRVCQNMIVSVSCNPSHNVDKKGGNLHLTVRPPDWWISMFSRHWEVEGNTLINAGGSLQLVCGPNTQFVATEFREHARWARYLIDGTMYLPRKNEKLEKIFDACHTRIPGERRWAPKITNKYSLEALPEVNAPVIIVGKGPTLDNLTADFFNQYPNSPVICINQSVWKVEKLKIKNPVYLIQHDHVDAKPKNVGTKLIIEFNNGYLYPGVDNRYLFNRFQLGVENLTACSAIEIAKQHFKATQLFLCCFDAATHEDLEYAECVGVKAGRPDEKKPGERFLKHRAMIVPRLEGIKTFWVTPDLDGQVAYTPQLLQDNPVEHHEPDQAG